MSRLEEQFCALGSPCRFFERHKDIVGVPFLLQHALSLGIALLHLGCGVGCAQFENEARVDLARLQA